MSRHLRSASLAFALFLGAASLPAQSIPPGFVQALGDLTRNGKAIQVEDQVITYADVRRALAPVVEITRSSSTGPEDFDRRMSEQLIEVVSNLINDRLIVRDFNDQKLKFPPSVVDAEVERQLVERFGNDRLKFQGYLDSQGLNRIEYHKKIEEEMIVGVMRQRIKRTQAEISPEKILSFYQRNKLAYFQDERVRLRMIVLKPSEGKTLETLKTAAADLAKRHAAGEKFADLAKKNSMDGRAASGGDWDWVRRDDLRPELAGRAFAVETGKVSDPFVFNDQVYLIHVEDHRAEGIQPLAEVRDRIEKILLDRLVIESQDRWLQRLRKKAFIRFY